MWSQEQSKSLKNCKETNPVAGGSVKGKEKTKTDLIVPRKYTNTLPDIPFDMKFLECGFNTKRFIDYKPTSLEENYKYENLTATDMGVHVDLVDPDQYLRDPNAKLHPDDEKLLEDEAKLPNSGRSEIHNRSVSWLRRGQYISKEEGAFHRATTERVETSINYNIKKRLVHEEVPYLDRDGKIAAIEKTFEDNKKEITKHPSKANVVPVEICPIFPDFENWKHSFVDIAFDGNPLPDGGDARTQTKLKSQALLRGVKDESGNEFVGYFVPTEKTLDKQENVEKNVVLNNEKESDEYKLIREYNWNVKSKPFTANRDNYFFVYKPDGVFYNEVETKVSLNKTRKKFVKNRITKLIVKDRPLTEDELRMQRCREDQLQSQRDENIDESENKVSVSTLTEAGTNAAEERNNDDIKIQENSEEVKEKGKEEEERQDQVVTNITEANVAGSLQEEEGRKEAAEGKNVDDEGKDETAQNRELVKGGKGQGARGKDHAGGRQKAGFKDKKSDYKKRIKGGGKRRK